MFKFFSKLFKKPAANCSNEKEAPVVTGCSTKNNSNIIVTGTPVKPITNEPTPNERVDTAYEIVKKYNQSGEYKISEKQIGNIKEQFAAYMDKIMTKQDCIGHVRPIDAFVECAQRSKEFTHEVISSEDILGKLKENFNEICEIAHKTGTYYFKYNTECFTIRVNFVTGSLEINLSIPFNWLFEK